MILSELGALLAVLRQANQQLASLPCLALSWDHLSDRWGRMRVLFAGLLGYAAVLGGLPFVTHPVLIGVWSLAVVRVTRACGAFQS